MSAERADRVAYAAGVAYRDGQLERAAHLIATAMGLDPARRDLWESRAQQVMTRAGRSGLRREVALRLLAAGIDANDPGLQQAARHNQAPGIAVPVRKTSEMDSDLNEADKAREHLNELLDRPGGQVRADRESITWARAVFRQAIERQHRSLRPEPVPGPGGRAMTDRHPGSRRVPTTSTVTGPALRMVP
jgi:hypothetical protein